jgi:DNA-binding transcriptional ArsR family regulator
VLANSTRLRIFRSLVEQSPQTVSAIARDLQLPLPVTSQSLRALEARGLLTARRVGRQAHYRLATTTSGAAHKLVMALRSAFLRDTASLNSLFKAATAFTHPRRVEIFRALQVQACTLVQIRVATRISTPALLRHLGKLEARGLVTCREGIYWATHPDEPFARALARLATA